MHGENLIELQKWFYNYADKLDIWHVVIHQYYSKDKRNNTIVLDLPDLPNISDDVVLDVLAEKIVRKENRQTVNDFKVMQMSWVFDLNFVYTYKQVLKRGYINTLAELISPDADKKRKILQIVDSHLNYNSEVFA